MSVMATLDLLRRHYALKELEVERLRLQRFFSVFIFAESFRAPATHYSSLVHTVDTRNHTGTSVFPVALPKMAPLPVFFLFSALVRTVGIVAIRLYVRSPVGFTHRHSLPQREPPNFKVRATGTNRLTHTSVHTQRAAEALLLCTASRLAMCGCALCSVVT